MPLPLSWVLPGVLFCLMSWSAVQLSTLSNMPRVLAGCGLTTTDLMRHCGFLWCWMFEAYASADWPAGRFILLADMSGLKLGQAVGEGQVSGRAHATAAFWSPSRDACVPACTIWLVCQLSATCVRCAGSVVAASVCTVSIESSMTCRLALTVCVLCRVACAALTPADRWSCAGRGVQRIP